MPPFNSRCLLLVEDTEDDIFFMRRAIAAADIGLDVQVALDGQAAVDYLDGRGVYQDRTAYPMPVMVFLDLKLPRASGLEVLRWARAQLALRALPVLVLTSSREDSDIQEAYSLGANSFLVKPPNALQLNELVKGIQTYWLINPHLALPALSPSV